MPLLLLLKSVEFDDDVALLLSVAGLVMAPHVAADVKCLEGLDGKRKQFLTRFTYSILIRIFYVSCRISFVSNIRNKTKLNYIFRNTANDHHIQI